MPWAPILFYYYLYIIAIYFNFQYPDFTWERQTQGVILGAFFYGYIFTQIPGGYLATKFGGKRIFLIGIAATSVMTLLTPFLTHQGIGFLITTRVLEGLFEVLTIIRRKGKLGFQNPGFQFQVSNL